MIREYAKNVFTHEGQSTVEDFGKEIMKMASKIGAVTGLTVYVGYHGDQFGNWHHDFDKSEDAEAQKIGDNFPNAKLVWCRKPGLDDIAIKDAFNKGNVFFTWCDSDAKIKSVMGIK